MATNNVYPSGAARAASCAPMMVLPPGRLSTITGTFQLSVILAASVRDTMSVPPPGANGTMIWIWRLG
jgi:hypothetical protein